MVYIIVLISSCRKQVGRHTTRTVDGLVCVFHIDNISNEWFIFQLTYVNNLQNLLDRALSRLDRNEDEHNSAALRIQVHQLRQRSQEVFIMLHVCNSVVTKS